LVTDPIKAKDYCSLKPQCNSAQCSAVGVFIKKMSFEIPERVHP